MAQYLHVDKDAYSPQELIEEVLVNSGCIENIELTNVVGGNFSSGDKSYGYFENNNSSFPFEKGIVMSTGKLSNVPGPNNGLSDDDAPGWAGDQDLENYFDLNYTVNATVLEFDFTPNANNIQFRYIFASEEYRENESTTCQYSDAFAFLIRPENETDYENLAVVPGTDIPVKVTTVRPEIPESCPAENEEYFAGFNDFESPIIFNGQTEILTAQAEVIPGENYHIKLVIADDINYRYDSAVFLEGESFNIGAELGEDISGLCEDETVILQPEDIGNNPTNYQWYKIEENGNETLLTEGNNQNSFEVSEEGKYKVVLEYGNSCFAEDEIQVSYVDFDSLENLNLSSCIPSEENPNGFIYDLFSFENIILQGHDDFSILDFYLTEEDALNDANAIENPEIFHSSAIGENIFVKIISERGCLTTLQLTLTAVDESLNPVNLYACPDENTFNKFTFNLNQAIPEIQDQLDIYIDFLAFYETEMDAFLEENPIENSLEVNIGEIPKSVFAKIEGNLGCQGLVEIILNDLEKPVIDPNYIPPAFCDSSEESVLISSGVFGNEEDFTFEWEDGSTTPFLEVSEPGEYEVKISKPHLISGDTLYCSSTHIVEVIESEKPEVDYLLIGEPGNYKIEIIAEGTGNYQYAIDDENWTDENIFEIEEAGKHYYHVKDLNGCGSVSKEFYVIDYMKYFTPNADGINDYWKLLGVPPKDSKIKNIQIFDRYGKLLKTMKSNGKWDGNFHGKPLPSNDYWFKINFENGKTFKSNFSLIR